MGMRHQEDDPSCHPVEPAAQRYPVVHSILVPLLWLYRPLLRRSRWLLSGFAFASPPRLVSQACRPWSLCFLRHLSHTGVLELSPAVPHQPLFWRRALHKKCVLSRCLQHDGIRKLIDSRHKRRVLLRGEPSPQTQNLIKSLAFAPQKIATKEEPTNRVSSLRTRLPPAASCPRLPPLPLFETCPNPRER